ncbi:hypothetical protein E2562_004729 [Oryza meyeriana var. granulata]|uniref:Retroviral polymerase SH3-like domain-containing protein n=1 Tax=Oryza meyeriana var. granulata TaxID=110450 RepID=A0A6G1DG70_9ORYZ|nr:hypothetical protein E2562_004729 [Oryza meyeriana var. granulata]
MRAYILPPQVKPDGMVDWLVRTVDLAAENVRRRRAHRVDWATLIWYLSENEMTAMANRRTSHGACYYGAYWQRLSWDGTAQSGGMRMRTSCMARSTAGRGMTRPVGRSLRPMIFVGYEDGSKAYRVYDPSSHRVHVTWDVVFNEGVS